MTETTLFEPACVVLENEGQPLKNQSEKIILDSLDESLVSFGESAKQAVYSRLRKQYHIERQEIPFRIEAFASAIEEMFGDCSRLIEIKIMEAVHARAKGFLFIPTQEKLTFKEYMQSLACFLENSMAV